MFKCQVEYTRKTLNNIQDGQDKQIQIFLRQFHVQEYNLANV